MSELTYLKKPQKYLFDGCKLLFHQKRLQDYLDGKKIAPLHIDMGIHKSCNMRCIYCYGVKQKPSPEYIPKDRLLMLADDAKECGVKSLAIIGDGEPTMNKGLYAFVKYGKSIGLDMSVATNGLLLTEKQVKILTDSLVWLRFNISGVDKYDYIHTTKNGLAKFEQVIKWAVKHKGKCTVGLQMVCIPECFSEILPLAKKAVEWKVDYLVIKQFSDGGTGMPTQFDMDSYNNAIQALQIAEGMSTNETKIIVKWSAIQDTRDITKHHKWGFDRCIDLPFIFQISGNGKCYPCGYLFGNSDFCYGDVTKSRLRDILYSGQYWDTIKKVADTPLEQLCQGQCRHCFTNKFMFELLKVYAGNLHDALSKLCDGESQYQKLLQNPPDHINFI